jgi:hypothetical protein
LKVSLVLFGAPSLTRGRVCHLSVYSQSTVVSIYIEYLHTVLYTFDIYNIYLVLDTFTIKRIKYNMYNIYRPLCRCLFYSLDNAFQNNIYMLLAAFQKHGHSVRIVTGRSLPSFTLHWKNGVICRPLSGSAHTRRYPSNLVNLQKR